MDEYADAVEDAVALVLSKRRPHADEVSHARVVGERGCRRACSGLVMLYVCTEPWESYDLMPMRMIMKFQRACGFWHA